MCPEAPAPTEQPRLRVASIPHAGPYVDAVLPASAVRVGSGNEWLDADHLTAHAGDVDVVHLHAGAGHGPLADPDRWTGTLRRLDVPLVVTAHRLYPPEHAAGRPDGCLAAVLADAEVVLTLTPGAAAEIGERYGRTAIVVAHPSVAEPVPLLGAERGLVGLRLGSGRPSSALRDPEALLRAALSGAVSGGGRLRVLLDAGAEAPVSRALADAGAIELVEVRRDRPDWPAQLQQLHVAVLPEPCGTHSRDLEICRDVGTRVVAPDCGWFAEQWSEVVTYGAGADGEVDGVSVTAAVGAALARPAPQPADRGWRGEQRAAVRQVHAQVYAQVAAARRTA